jgi:mono/diheme cytochrome c family protein
MKQRLLAFLTLAWLLSACSLAADVTPPPGYQPQPTATPAIPAQAPNPLLGQALYQKNCAACHGDAGMGDGFRADQLLEQNIKVPALADPALARKSSPSRWFGMVTQGNLERFMPPFSSLSEAERWNVVAYSLSLNQTPEMIAAGAELFAAHCSECHTQQAPDLLTSEYLAAHSAEAIYKGMGKANGEMPSFANLGDSARWQIAAYLQAQLFDWEPPAASEAASSPEAASIPGEAATPAATIPLSSTITGTVVNASGGTAPEALEITLFIFEQSTDTPQLVLTTTTSTLPGGAFSFENVALQEGYILGAAATYQGALYGSNIVRYGAETGPVALTLDVYDSTTDASALVLERLHVVFDFSQPGQAAVTEIVAISNPGDRAVVAAEPGGAVLSFELPEGADGLQFEHGMSGRFLLTAAGFAVTDPVLPGADALQFSFTYALPYADHLAFSQPVALNLAAVTVLVADPGVTVQSGTLTDGGTFQGTAYRRYDGGSLAAGSSLEFTLRGKPSASAVSALTSGGNSQWTLVIGLGALGAALIGVGGWFYWRSRASERASTDGVGAPAAYEDADALMDAILTLDDQFRASQIPEDAYRARRAELKDRLQTALGKD